METKTNGNDLAFARASFYHSDGGYDVPQAGLTIRQYYAGMVLQGLLASGYNGTDNYVEQSVIITDLLIEQLNKDKNSDVSEMENTDREPEIGDMVFAWDNEGNISVDCGFLISRNIEGTRNQIEGRGWYSHCSLKNPLIK